MAVNALLISKFGYFAVFLPRINEQHNTTDIWHGTIQYALGLVVEKALPAN